MIIKTKMLKALNQQINAELYSSYLYLSMAAYFESENLRGFARWMKAQSREEYGHAMKIFEYALGRGGKVDLGEIEAPRTEWKSALGVFEETLAHELKVTGLIHGLVKLAKEENDYATEVFLQWFVTEQVEEESSALQTVETLKAIKDSANGLFMLDHALGERK